MAATGDQQGGAASHSNMDPEQLREKRNDYIAKQVRWLLLLRHCAKCQAADDSCQYGESCAEARPLWRHVITCSDGNCTYPR
jgi:E1A/CREB-binding protein